MPLIQTKRIQLWYEQFPANEGVPEKSPIVLICGLSMPAVFWPQELLDALAAAGHPVVIFDNRDIGLSDRIHGKKRPPAPLLIGVARLFRVQAPVPYLVDDMADDTIALLDELGIEQAHIVGMSMGGMIAQSLAIRYPERVLTLCSWASMGGRFRDLLIQPHMMPKMLRGPAKDLDERLQQAEEMWIALGTKTHPTNIERAKAMIQVSLARTRDETGIPRQFAAIMATPSRLPKLKKLSLPTLVVHGTGDPLVRFSSGKKVAQTIPNAKFFPIEDYGHNLAVGLMPTIAEQIVENARLAEPKLN